MTSTFIEKVVLHFDVQTEKQNLYAVNLAPHPKISCNFPQ